jgi:hypothetical protein
MQQRFDQLDFTAISAHQLLLSCRRSIIAATRIDPDAENTRPAEVPNSLASDMEPPEFVPAPASRFARRSGS